MAGKYKTSMNSMLLIISDEAIPRCVARWFSLESLLLPFQCSSQNKVINIPGLNDSVISAFRFVHRGKAFYIIEVYYC